MTTLDFPEPDGPTSVMSREPRRNASRTSSTRASRPKKSAASASPNGRRPLYGFRASAVAISSASEAGAIDGSCTRMRSRRACSAGDGSRPRSAISRSRNDRNVRRASAWRPDRYSASISSSAHRSRSGSSRRAASSIDTTDCGRPVSSSAVARASMASMCRSFRRRMYGWANSSKVKSASAGPRQSASAPRRRRAPSRGSDARRSVPSRTNCSNRCASIVSGELWSVYPGARVTITARPASGSRAFRSSET